MGKFRKFGIFSLIILAAGCAKEQSQEQRVREEVNRKYARLSKAAGVYRGYLKRRPDNFVPVELTVTVQNNPVNGQDEPVLQGSLRIGLFGGVKLASSAGSFDWGNGRLSFTFERSGGSKGTSSGTKAMEVRAMFTDQVLHDAVLDAPRQGTFPLVIDKKGPTLFNDDLEIHYTWQTPGSLKPTRKENADAPADAILSLALRNDSQAAPANLDLPYLPGLDGTVRFTPMGQSPQVASQVIYDPLDGTLELYFTSVSHLRFDGLFLTAIDGNKLTPSELKGYSALSSVQVASLTATRLLDPKTFPIPALPPSSYRGIYQGQGIEYRSEVYFDYLGTQGSNSLEFPFPQFPRLRLEQVICVGDQADRRRTLNLVSIDYLNSIAAFQFLGSTNPKDLELKYSPGWKRLNGIFLSGDGVGTVRPHLDVEPHERPAKDCADDL